MRTCKFGACSALALVAVFFHSVAAPQTTAGASSTIVVPLVARTGSYASVITAFNPNAESISVDATLYDAAKTATPGAKTCEPLSIPAGASVEFDLAGRCALSAGPSFGALLLTERTGTRVFYGYARTQTPTGVGFSTEGFPIENFNDQLQHVTGLERTAAAAGLPAFQTNCFVAALADNVDYQLLLFDGTTNASIGTPLAGTLTAHQQIRYLDVFHQAGAPDVDYRNVRAEFRNLSAANRKLIGFCTVQENTTFSADFRIAKSYGGTPQNAFVQGGNAFGTTGRLGTADDQPLELLVNGARVMRYEMSSVGLPNVIGGDSGNSANGNFGVTIAGGGGLETTCGPHGNTSCGNQAMAPFATIGGGFANEVAGGGATVAGGYEHAASGDIATMAMSRALLMS